MLAVQQALLRLARGGRAEVRGGLLDQARPPRSGRKCLPRRPPRTGFSIRHTVKDDGPHPKVEPAEVLRWKGAYGTRNVSVARPSPAALMPIAMMFSPVASAGATPVRLYVQNRSAP